MYRVIITGKKYISRSVSTKPAREKNKSSSEYCLELVKTCDYENFICTLLLQNATRSSAFAVRSFNVEVARVAEQVSQETIGLMRFKFWEDALESCYSKDLKAVPKHPVALELSKAVKGHSLSKRYLNNLIAARKENIVPKDFVSLEDMEKYAERTVSNVLYLILEGCGVKNVKADHAASHLGKAQGIVQLLRQISHFLI
ncbi:hypothetical protein NQ318_011064 [Aromia moschata]|uniref:NADH dehydrogenase (Ubiquinone) complex I, assembly factor 6 n=1 Tax=Aromia moschata TaxID=1265417 RepID=A0AAV8YR36_9CUCU|nr:hypothetical protein NQ318_011064 [Aromia moschata]